MENTILLASCLCPVVEGSHLPRRSRKLFVFGDKFVDAGNLPRPVTSLALRGWFYPYGISDTAGRAVEEAGEERGIPWLRGARARTCWQWQQWAASTAVSVMAWRTSPATTASRAGGMKGSSDTTSRLYLHR